MKIKRVALFFAATAAILVATGTLSKAETWKITSLEWPPYSGAQLSEQGTSVHRLRGLLKQEGIDLVVDFFPWLRAQQYAKNQEQYVGYFPAWPEEIKKGFVSSLPVDSSCIGIMKYSGANVAWSTFDALFRHHKVGLVQTYVYPDVIRKAMEKYPRNVDWTPNERLLAKKLSAKRYEVALTDPAVMLHMAGQEGIVNIEVIKPCVEQKALVVAFRNDAENKHRIELMRRLLGNSN